MITAAFAQHFAQEWVAAWNARDLPRILSHYRDDFEMSSPLIRLLMQEPRGTLKGKEAIAQYWSLALARQPGLHFSLEQVLIGANSVTLLYQGSRGFLRRCFCSTTKGEWRRRLPITSRRREHAMTRVQSTRRSLRRVISSSGSMRCSRESVSTYTISLTLGPLACQRRMKRALLLPANTV